jgi:acid stress-induced BolA-like protein IbaG/YrbA
MDIREKVVQALRSAIQLDETILESDDGLFGYIVSPDFRGKDSYQRQTMIFDTLSAPASNLTLPEIRKVVSVVAFTPEEWAVHGPEMQRSE